MCILACCFLSFLLKRIFSKCLSIISVAADRDHGIVVPPVQIPHFQSSVGSGRKLHIHFGWPFSCAMEGRRWFSLPFPVVDTASSIQQSIHHLFAWCRIPPWVCHCRNSHLGWVWPGSTCPRGIFSCVACQAYFKQLVVAEAIKHFTKLKNQWKTLIWRRAKFPVTSCSLWESARRIRLESKHFIDIISLPAFSSFSHASTRDLYICTILHLWVFEDSGIIRVTPSETFR